MLVPEANIYHESEVNDKKNNVEPEQDITKKGKGKGK